MTNKVSPRIRFKSFLNEWRPDNLSSVFQIENGYAFKSNFFQDSKSDHVVLTPGNVHIGGGYQEGKGRFYNVKGSFPLRFILNSGDMFITLTDLTPTAEALGYPAIVPDNEITYLHNQRLGKIVDYKFDKYFLYYLLTTNSIHKQIVASSSGTTVKHSSPEKVLKVKSYFTDTKEQIKIGSFFQNLDKLIDLHKQQHQKLTALKKAMLQKMFPKEGQTVPEIRFKGFEGDWKKFTLEDKVEFYSGLTYSPEDVVSSGGTFVLRSSNIKDGLLINADNVFVKPEKVNSTNVKKGDIIVVVRNGSRHLIGKHARVKSNMPKTVIGAFMTGVRYSNSSYLNALLNTDLFKNQIAKNMGATINQITTGAFRKMSFYFPNETEQSSVGQYFDQLDNLIFHHGVQLAKIQNVKKACLEKMFV